MSDSSEDEDLSRFSEVIDNSFTKLIDKSRGVQENNENLTKKSNKYLDEASHYNDVKVPEIMQKQIGDKISKIISKQVQYVDVAPKKVKKQKVKGGVRLFKDSTDFLTCEEAEDTDTANHNKKSKRLKSEQKMNVAEDLEKYDSVVVNGDFILSKEDTKCWKSRRKEKIFKYKSIGKSKVLVAVE